METLLYSKVHYSTYKRKSKSSCVFLKDKGFMQRLFAIQEVLIVIQSALDEVASSGERIKK